ncbi:hypothetical protein SAMN05518865_11091 [Duganella sp. CF458]|uniref:hypothetical protein n=1 Tax=Duganella sp. CF458 TaxID=1884368 RepID=UPI0008DEB8E6|nr:hypothetical protein [Duganella sp. CF458]SFG27626.1 hypothetical protein SAMN05518865_11091 [Duganella sp. CF458]
MGRYAFLLAAGISLFGAMIHFAAPWLGPEWYAFLQAPPKVVASAQAGGLLAPAGALGIGLLMLVCAAYALAGAGLLRWLPFAQMVQGTIAAICLLRGLLVLPYLYKFPERVWTFDVLASLIWFAAGLGFLVGILRSVRKQPGVAANSSGAQAGSA